MELYHHGLKFACAKAALPDDGSSPPGILQILAVAQVARDIAGKLLLPEIRPCRRHGRVTTSLMPVPETAMHLDGDLPFRQHDVGAPRQALVMKPEPKTHRMQGFTKPDLGPRVLSTYSGHHPGTGLLVHYIGHVMTALAARTWYVT